MRISEIDSLIGQKLRLHRKLTNLSQKSLAQKIGISFQQIQKYESGANRISVSRLLQLCDVLNISYDAFFQERWGTKEEGDQKLYSTETLQFLNLYYQMPGASREKLARFLEGILAPI